AREQALCFFYWMQTEAPRPDGGSGYPGLYLRPDITGTDDGFAKYPYIRESRRLQALFVVTENHVGHEARGQDRAEAFADSVGIGSYRIDLHPSTGGDNYVDIASLPFQIPLGALVPVRVENLLAAGKSLGTTHISNGCYRLHPVEWNVGEAAGLLAAFCLEQGAGPMAVYGSREQTEAFQALLRRQGVELNWPAIGPV
ncbi:MAG: FAD-dependent oxidoreductase, partial [Gemmatimonadota bacterium]